MTYSLHYTSQDLDNDLRLLPTWSVYVEAYETPDSLVPIDGSTQHVSTHDTEELADAEARRLQAEWHLDPKPVCE